MPTREMRRVTPRKAPERIKMKVWNVKFPTTGSALTLRVAGLEGQVLEDVLVAVVVELVEVAAAAAKKLLVVAADLSWWNKPMMNLL